MKFICLMLVSLLVFGCGRNSVEKAVERQIEKSLEADGGGKAVVDIDGENISIETEDGSMKLSGGGKAKVPDNFPEDVLVYEGADVQVALSMPDGFSVVLQTKDAQAKVVDFYSAKMVDKGWSREMSADMGGQKMLAFKKDNRVVSLVTTGVDGGTQIALTVASE